MIQNQYGSSLCSPRYMVELHTLRSPLAGQFGSRSDGDEERGRSEVQRLSLDTASPTLRLRSDKGSKTGLVPVHPGQGPVMKRQTRRITDCLDCWKRGWCFLFFEQRTDGTPHGIWLCSDCIDKRPLALHWNNVCDEHDLQLASAPNVVNLAEAASLAAGDRLGESQGPQRA